MQFSGSMDDDWKRHLSQFTSLFDEYESDDKKLAVFFILFALLVRPSSTLWNLKTAITSASIDTTSEALDISDTKLACLNRKMKSVRFATYQATNRSNTESFKQIVADVEQLSILAHDEDQTNHALCSCV